MHIYENCMHIYFYIAEQIPILCVCIYVDINKLIYLKYRSIYIYIYRRNVPDMHVIYMQKYRNVFVHVQVMYIYIYLVKYMFTCKYMCIYTEICTEVNIYIYTYTYRGHLHVYRFCIWIHADFLRYISQYIY